jgi:hypothetical protein
MTGNPNQHLGIEATARSGRERRIRSSAEQAGADRRRNA